MKLLSILFFFSISIPGFAADTTWLPPKTVTAGGPVTGNYRSLDSNVPALLIQTYDPVEITGCVIESAGIGIKAYGGTKLNIHHNVIRGGKPTDNNQWGRALDVYHPQYLIFENNTVDHTGGLLVDFFNENTKSVMIRYNRIKNTDKRRVDMSEGDHRASILFNQVRGVTGEIAWNEFINEINNSWVEDNINLGNSGGLSGTPYLIHDNYIKGAYPYPLSADNYTGSGITVECNPGNRTYQNVSQYVNITNNQVVSVCNGGININGGHDIHATGNTIISSGLFPNGQQSFRFWGGAAIWNGCDLPSDVFNNISIKGNTIGYARPGINTPLPNRQDYVVTAGSPINILPTDNVSLPNPITLATEDAEYPKWQAKLAANGIKLGHTGSAVVVTPPPPVVVPVGTDEVTTFPAARFYAKIIPVDTFNAPSAIRRGSLQVISNDLKVFTATYDSAGMWITAVSPGVATGKITVDANVSGTTARIITKTFKVTVSAYPTRGIRIEWPGVQLRQGVQPKKKYNVRNN